jgi:sugar phosphate isomerase/epimerase
MVSCPPLFRHADGLRWNGESFAQLAEIAASYGLRIMVEHPPSTRFSLDDICTILEADVRLGFHLDVGHAHVGRLRLDNVLEHLGPRLLHVHLSDNRGQSDDHLPLGAGTINWPQVLRRLKQSGYDDTFTLEVFSADRDYLLLSAQKVRAWWQAEP